jgi:CBS domain-containing protein
MKPRPPPFARKRPRSRPFDLMRRYRIGCLPVVHEGRLVGLVTEEDFELASKTARSDLWPRKRSPPERRPPPPRPGRTSSRSGARVQPPAYRCTSVATISASRFVVPSSGCRNRMCPSDNRVCFQSRRCVPGQKLLLDHPLAKAAHELMQAVMRVMRPSPRALEDDRCVVLALGRRLEGRATHDPRPLAKQIDVTGVVHLIDQVRPARATADLAKHRLATAFRNHSM